MEENDHFNPAQHGFLPGRSCLSQLIAHFDCVTLMLETDDYVDDIYFDFAKALDKVNFMVTIGKLPSMGITGKVGRRIHWFLTNRKQTVTVDGVKCGLCGVKSDALQGSVLGPFISLMLIGDIDHEVIATFISSFAYDTRVAKAVSSVDDVQALQTDLKNIYRW